MEFGGKLWENCEKTGNIRKMCQNQGETEEILGNCRNRGKTEENWRENGGNRGKSGKKEEIWGKARKFGEKIRKIGGTLGKFGKIQVPVSPGGGGWRGSRTPGSPRLFLGGLWGGGSIGPAPYMAIG